LAKGLVGAKKSGIGTAEFVARTMASVLVDNALPAMGRGIQLLDEFSGGALSTVLHYVDPKTHGTATRRFLRDTCGFSQEFSQNVGDVVQYGEEISALVLTFGAGSAKKAIATAART
jgi:hypothetical protein